MNKKKVLVALCVVLCVAALAIYFVACNDTKKAQAYVTLEVNPSIELIVDESGAVLSINGLNDDGKVLIQNEEWVGKKLDKVIAEISAALEELGYVTAEKAQTMRMNIISENEKLKETVKSTIENGVSELKTRCNMIFEEAESITRDALIAQVLKANPGMTEEKADELTTAELIDLTRVAMIEKAEFAFVYLEDQFYAMKEMEFKFKYYEEMKSMLNGVSGFVVDAYDLLLTTLQTGVNTLTQLQKAIYEAQLETDINIENGETIMDNATKFAVNAIQTAINKLNNTIEKLDEEKVKYLDSINADELLNKAQNAINDAKDGFFAEYEDEFSEMIENAQNKLAQYKASLKGAE